MTNILITSGSAKLRLIDAFQRATHDIGAKVIIVDSNPECLAAQFADTFITVPRDNESNYEETILNLCNIYNISLIIPTRDEELTSLAAMDSTLKMRNIILPLPSIEHLRILLDKKVFSAYCHANGFPVLPSFEPDKNAPWPLFIREKESSGGKGARQIESYQKWLSLGLSADEVICQSVIEDKEYSIDVLMSLEGEPIQAVIRERCKVEHGECVEGIIVDIPRLNIMSMDLCKSLGLKGHNVVQAFCSPEGKIHIIEVNARFGGASMMSVEAGLSSPARLLQMIKSACVQIEKDISIGLKLSARPENPIGYIKEII